MTTPALDDVDLCYAIADRVWRRFRSLWGTLFERDDAVQTAVLNCWRRASRYDPNRASKSTFYWRCCYSAMQDLRKERLRLKVGFLRTQALGKWAEAIQDGQPTPPEAAAESERLELSSVIVDGLPSQERRAISLVFGLGGGDSHTLRGAGAVMGVSRERVRQVVDGALERLARALSRAETGEAPST